MPRVAPDGRRVAMTVRNEDAYSISLVDLMTGAVSELVAQGLAAVWSPDGQRIAFAVARPNGGLSLQIVPADRSSPPVSVLDDRSVNVPTSWSPDGRSIAFTRVEQGSPTGEDIYLIAPDGSGLRPAVPIAGNQHAGTFSPDGRWLAYVDAGNSSIFVSEVANFTRRWRADIDGGSSPGWSPDGRELFFLGGRQRDQLFTVAVTAKGNTLELAKPARITPVSMGTSIGFGLRRYDVTPDGKRFVFATADASTPTEIRMLLDFRSQLTAPLSR
jgi:Tol biopolymer transport system component